MYLIPNQTARLAKSSEPEIDVLRTPVSWEVGNGAREDLLCAWTVNLLRFWAGLVSTSEPESSSSELSIWNLGLASSFPLRVQGAYNALVSMTAALPEELAKDVDMHSRTDTATKSI